MLAGSLSVSTRVPISHGFVSIFSADKQGDDEYGSRARGHKLGEAGGGDGLEWRDGALQDLRLGGMTIMNGDLDLRGNRILNFDMMKRDFDELKVQHAIVRIPNVIESDRPSRPTVTSGTMYLHAYDVDKNVRR